MWKKLVAPLALVTFFWAISTITSTWYIRWLEESQARMLRDDLSTISSAGDIRSDVRRMERILDAGQPAAPATVAEMDSLEQAFEHHLQEAIGTSLTREEIDLDREIRARFETYRSAIQRQAREPDPTKRAAESRARQKLADEVTDAARRLGDVNESLMRAGTSRRSRMTSLIIAVRYGLLIVGLAAGILCILWISRLFNRSISRISITLGDAAMEMRVSGGPVDVGRVNVGDSGDLSRLQKQVDVVVRRIRQVTQELQAARQQAIDAARLAALGEMAAGVAHELRNPLTSVKLLVQASAQRLDRSMTERQYRIVLEEVSRMEGTIEQLLEFARPPRMNRSRRDLREIAAIAIAAHEGLARQAAVTVALDAPDRAVDAHVDPEQLRQVFSNLIQNGVEAAPPGGWVRVTIESAAGEEREGSGPTCRVSFADTGPGISPAVAQRLFEPFVTDKARGTGLGLAICQRIVREHGGSLTGANRVEGGAIFTMVLPGVTGAAPVPDAAHAPPARAPEGIPALADGADRPTLEHAHAEVAGH